MPGPQSCRRCLAFKEVSRTGSTPPFPVGLSTAAGGRWGLQGRAGGGRKSCAAGRSGSQAGRGADSLPSPRWGLGVDLVQGDSVYEIYGVFYEAPAGRQGRVPAQGKLIPPFEH